MKNVLKIAERIGWHGKILVVRRDLAGNVIGADEFHNLITDAGLDLIAEALRTTGFDSEVKYFAWGSDNTAPAATDTTLGSETARKQVTSQSSPGTGQTLTRVYVTPSEGVNPPTIEEFGWFAGASATATADSGVLVARVLYSRAKTSLESLQVDRTDTFS